jgi:hypothetical protein
MSFPAWHRQILFGPPEKIPLQYKRDDGNDNEDYYEPFCDFHRETGYPPEAQYEKHQSQHKENYREID